MEVKVASNESEAVAALTGRSVESLQAQDAFWPYPVWRWVSMRDGEAVGVLTAKSRPDGRTFIDVAGDGVQALISAAARQVVRPLYVRSDDRRLSTWLDLGFQVEMSEESFRFDFASMVAALRWTAIPDTMSIVSVSATDPSQLFILDNTIRNLVPGCEGWEGNWDLFSDELNDPAAYYVAIDETSARPVGLVRIWNNSTGPHLGLIGVLPEFRRTRIALPLLRTAVAEAATWGHTSFTASTSLRNPIHRRLVKLADQRLEVTHQLVRPVPSGILDR